ncbi:hypothetical protein [Vibrio rumoiensis]|uniref:Outer membrane protein beta-barrel domain-containing protein n=1 Tax=Vibrio rumoiensis 1S-45 TaxID=1188252 RepID=A0A1E5DYL3_9VIBR|nr:hypothetical protein [Vibrio rumoiensis]OEF22746.1 hypothetical protein A1QC_02995 [Vibrio rumoiensis 1S-45]
MKIKDSHRVLAGMLLSMTLSSAYAADSTQVNEQQKNGQLENTKQQEIEKEKNKLAEDPTKVVTQLGASYGGDQLKFSGSIGLGPVNKINASVDADGSEWRLGGSWLFDVGIVNVNFGKKEFDDDSNQNNYSIGTFMPLSFFGFEPWGTQVFAMAGYTYNDGEVACDTSEQLCGNDFDINDMNGTVAFVPSTSSAGYAGFFALKPITEKVRIISVAAGSLGSNDYHGYLFALGAGYSITKRQSVAAYGFLQDNNYGHDEQLGISYKYQFN